MKHTHAAAAIAFLIPSLALAGTPVTDTFGATTTERSGNRSYKLNVYEIKQTVSLENIAQYLDASGSPQVNFVVYREDITIPNQWHLIWQSGAQAIGTGPGYKISPNVGLALQSGRVYALGIYLLDSEVSYFYGTPALPESVTWADRTGAVWADNGFILSVQDPLYDTEDTIGYGQQISVEIPVDLDGDTYDDLTDCDDTDADVHPGATEVCDGYDDDCDGNLFAGEDVDADEDGSVSCLDCDDADATIYPGAEEDPCGTTDNNCDGVFPDGSECDTDDTDDTDGEDSGIGGGGEDVHGQGCACSSVPEGSLGGRFWIATLLALGAARRRHRTP